MKFVVICCFTSILSMFVWSCTCSPEAGRSPEELRRKIHELNVAGKAVEALPLVQIIVDETGKIFGKRGTEYALAVDALAHQNALLGRFEIADSLFSLSEPVLQVSRIPDTMRTESFLYQGLTKMGMQDYDSAERLFRRTLDIAVKTNDPHHPRIIKSLIGLANTMFMKGEFALAIPNYERLLLLLSTEVAATDSSYLSFVNSLTLCYYGVGQLDLAINLLKETMVSLERSENDCLPCEIRTLELLGRIYLKQRDEKNALKAYGDAIARVDQTSDTMSTLYFDVAFGYGRSLAAVGSAQDATTYFEKALLVSERIDGLRSAKYIEAAQTVARYYKAIGKAERSAELDSIVRRSGS